MAAAKKPLTLPGLLPDPNAYMFEALARGGKIIKTVDTPTGYVETTWEFGASDEAYTEVVFTSERFPDLDDQTDPVIDLPAKVEADMEALADPSPAASPVAGTAKPVVLPELSHYSLPLREHLLVQSAYYDDEIARLARLTENAMKAQSAIHSALSSLDRDAL